MKTILSLTIAMLLLAAQTATSQDYIFRVLANKGTNQVKKAGTSEAASLKTGEKLNSGDQIIAVSGSYIGLVHRTGKTMEIRTPGTHNISDLEGKVSKGTSSVANRYMNFVMNKMNADDGNVNANYRRNSNVTGAVSRATGSVAVRLLLKDSKNPNKVYGEVATIRWEGSEETTNYLITVKNVFDEVLYSVETTDTKISLDFSNEKLANERFVIVNVMDKDNESLKSRDYGIQRLSPDEAKTVETKLSELSSEVADESSLDKLVYASFFEENNLYLDALTKYEEAVELSPEVEDFQAIYDEFKEINALGN